MNSPEDELEELTKEDMETINKVASGIIKKYNLAGKTVKTAFVYNIDKNDRFSSLKHKPNAYKRSETLLNNEDKIEEYFKKNDTGGLSKSQFIRYLSLINETAKTEDIKEKEEVERKQEQLRHEKEEAERQREEAERQKEEAERQRDEKHQAYVGNKEDYQQRLAEQLNEIKDLRNKNAEYEQRLKEIDKAPLKREYINDKVFNESYSLDKGELMDVISKDINKGKLPSDADPEEIADAIYAKATSRIYKNLKRIKNLTALTGYNPDLYNKLPPEVAEIIKNYIDEKIKDDIRKKNIKYILPKDKPRWEHAMESKQLNPMLGRSAWRVN